MAKGRICFGTTNQGKINEVKSILGLEIEGVGLSVNEIQSLDPVEVALDKARVYFERLGKAVLIEDVSLVFNALGRLPGTYIDGFITELGNEGLIKLMVGRTDRSAVAQTTLVFIDAKGGEHIFTGEIRGRIADNVAGDSGFGWDPIFIPEGETRTFGEMDASLKAKYSMRARALEKFKKWLAENPGLLS